ncbi:MAG: hypothetical protein PHY28_02225 [Dehalococcoidales bacterium]|jgi:hypothetical protein|nr:hypothetical protein [Dehalococcoidales bacterium]
MPGKSKHKKIRYSSSNQARVAKTPAATAATMPAGGSASGINKPSPAPVKPFSSASRAATAQYAPDQFKDVGTELRVAGILSAVILIIIIALYFILR